MNRRICLPRLYAITDRSLARKQSHADIVAELLAGGCRWIQVREKALPDDIFFEQLVRCRDLCQATGAMLIVNDRVDLAWAARIPGVHLGQTDASPGLARKILGPECVIGRSTHSLAQAGEAEADPAVDYVAIGPLFSTQTKLSDHQQIGLDGLRMVRQAVRKPLAAIGGINHRLAAPVLQAGCDAVAVISALMGAGGIAAATVEFMGLLESAIPASGKE